MSDVEQDEPDAVDIDPGLADLAEALGVGDAPDDPDDEGPDPEQVDVEAMRDRIAELEAHIDELVAEPPESDRLHLLTMIQHLSYLVGACMNNGIDVPAEMRSDINAATRWMARFR